MNLEAVRRNEKRKLGALWCNGISTAVVAAGILAPTAGLIFDPERVKKSVDALGFILLGSIVAALILFAIGKTFLNRLEDAEE